MAKLPANCYELRIKTDLKRAGVPADQLLHFYVAAIRPVLEYCTPVWHYAITRAQAQQLESIQKRAIHFILYIPTLVDCLTLMFSLQLN